LVACASNDGSAGAQTRFRGALAGILPQTSEIRAGRQQAFIDFGRLHISFDQRAMGDIEKQRSRSVSHVSGTFADEAEADVVLRKHDRTNTFPVFPVSFSRTHSSFVSVKFASADCRSAESAAPGRS